MQASHSSPNPTKIAFSSTTSSSYGSHTGHAKRSPSPGPNLSQTRSSPTTSSPSSSYNRSHYVPTNNLSTGHFALGGSELKYVQQSIS